ncbi:MAG: BamA/TamA family outer membrane protein [Salinivirgaceae bacterium]|nr:BamA/TamA family outer membrane protein [Salinivirgaceae bacterium]
MKLKKIILYIFFAQLFSFSLYAQKEYKVHQINFEGNATIPSELLLKQLNTQTKKKYERLLFWKKFPEFGSFILLNDVARLTKYYQRNGFLNPEITYKLDTLPHRKHINIHILIKENNFVRIKDLNYNYVADTINFGFIDSIKFKLPLKKEDRFVDDNVYKTKTIVLHELSNLGYPFSKVGFQINISDSNKFANINFSVEPKQKSYFGNVSISGDSIVPKKFIYKYVSFSEGDLYSQKKIDNLQSKLFDTELFQFVVIRSVKDSVKNNLIPIEIYLKELPHWTLEAGAGYGTDDRFRVSLLVTRLNFLGGTRKLIFKAKTSYFIPYSFELKFIQPDLFIQNLDFVLSPVFSREKEESYTIGRLGTGFNFIYYLNKKSNVSFTYSIERIDLNEIVNLQLTESEIKRSNSAIIGGYQYSSTNNIFNPTQGYKFNANVAYNGFGFNQDFQFYKIDISNIKYFSLSTNVVLAAKVKAGVLQTFKKESHTPIGERYYMGGASSLRGWGRNEISPISTNGFAVGGNTMIEGSLELRFPIYDIFGGAVFVDAGNVWTDSYAIYANALHYNTGLGIRIKTPIGPFRFDMATPIINDALGFQFFISIGHAF